MGLILKKGLDSFPGVGGVHKSHACAASCIGLRNYSIKKLETHIVDRKKKTNNDPKMNSFRPLRSSLGPAVHCKVMYSSLHCYLQPPFHFRKEI